MKTKQNKMVETNKQNKKSLLKDKRGLSTVEYIIILVLIAAAGVSLWTEFGTLVQEKLQGAIDEVGTI